MDDKSAGERRFTRRTALKVGTTSAIGAIGFGSVTDVASATRPATGGRGLVRADVTDTLAEGDRFWIYAEPDDGSGIPAPETVSCGRGKPKSKQPYTIVIEDNQGFRSFINALYLPVNRNVATDHPEDGTPPYEVVSFGDCSESDLSTFLFRPV